MITEEQIKNLTPGDPLVIYTTFDHIDDDGDLWFSCPQKFDSENFEYIDPEYVSLPGEPVEQPKPKYDPCRKFRKGDKVRVVEWNGRDIARVGQIGYAVSDEHNSRVELAIDGWTKEVFYPACHLELVTPVEELEPYRVETGGYNRFRIKKGNLEYSYFPFGEHCVLSMDEAKAAAEAECDRLNAEWRKEQK